MTDSNEQFKSLPQWARLEIIGLRRDNFALLDEMALLRAGLLSPESPPTEEAEKAKRLLHYFKQLSPEGRNKVLARAKGTVRLEASFAKWKLENEKRLHQLHGTR